MEYTLNKYLENNPTASLKISVRDNEFLVQIKQSKNQHTTIPYSCTAKSINDGVRRLDAIIAIEQHQQSSLKRNIETLSQWMANQSEDEQEPSENDQLLNQAYLQGKFDMYKKIYANIETLLAYPSSDAIADFTSWYRQLWKDSTDGLVNYELGEQISLNNHHQLLNELSGKKV